MFVGIDLGTSAVKVVLVDADQRIVAAASERLHPLRPLPLWSEDDPEAWWSAVERAMASLAAGHALAGVAAIGLSGQMHGAVLLDGEDRPVRPAILWNDGRAVAEAGGLAEDMALQFRLGVKPMPGLTGPKILWLAHHEPDILARTRHLLLPKDFIRLKLGSDHATDVSDAAGTWLLDQARRDWSTEAVEACGVDPGWLPRLHESREAVGELRPDLCRRWGMAPGTVLAAGAGDAMAGAFGIGCIAPGRACLSLGTSAQIFVADAIYRPDPESLVHAFCHAAPATWCRMAALLNGASPLEAVARWVGGAADAGPGEIGALLEAVERDFAGPSRLLALPYLSGERTPHDDPYARGVIFGLEPGTRRTEIVQAMLEGVAFSLADGLDVLRSAEEPLRSLAFVGGGARSAFWARIVASVLDVTLVRHEAAERGPAFGAARLARLAVSGEDCAAVATAPPIERVIEPDPGLRDAYATRLPAFRSLYRALRPEFARPHRVEDHFGRGEPPIAFSGKIGSLNDPKKS